MHNRNSLKEFYEKHIPIAMAKLEEVMGKENYRAGLWLCVLQNLMCRLYLEAKVPFALFETSLNDFKAHYLHELERLKVISPEIEKIQEEFLIKMEEIKKEFGFEW